MDGLMAMGGGLKIAAVIGPCGTNRNECVYEMWKYIYWTLIPSPVKCISCYDM